MSASQDTSSSDLAAPTEAIVEAIAAHEGVDVTDIEPPAYDPLYTVVNPEALDRLFQTPVDSEGAVRVVLEYEGYEITVDSDGDVEVVDRPLAGDSIDRPLED
ncbi:HalOD1 output domain-containing protein [Natronolimnohabitans sp. A-GB9]|uniref:HalOD1 output domain-containing protein n=1 Tax=Natronolimnohabitans sp. A-GB9 TaxID=3069757 RepID=UPI0027AEF200|nr:HalOD1 output domain-containing protein [Natronolimnohabitans sp. A-GB9]MDQ2052306.1 HalOD1 output domain-containing protein [Natronolimnohabitans sp. A-GB9]